MTAAPQSTLRVGDRIKDNDPRMACETLGGTKNQRVLTIVELLPNGVFAKDVGGRRFAILRRRIFTDGKPRKTGFSLVKDPK